MRVLIPIAFATLLAVVQCAPQYGYYQPIGGDLINGGSLISGQQIAGPASSKGGDKYLPPDSTTQKPIINKQFYLISPPEDNSNAGKTKHLVLGRPQRNYRVVFIKAPVPDGDGQKYSVEYAPQEEKTVIYVLSKKPEELDASNIATPAPTTASKPEVFFIKYKTDQEAEQAQKEIQAEYDNLDGPNEVIRETSPPITSVIGSLDGLNPDGSYNYRKINKDTNEGRVKEPSSEYLPAFYKH